jgi:L-amino acid N-acyltransferase YncA
VPRLRDATAADAAAVAAVQVASWRVAYRGLLPDELLDGLSVADRERHWSGVLAGPDPRSGIVVAEDASGLIGFAAVGRAPDRDPADAVGQLFAIYLAPPALGTGVGRRLHAAALDRLRAAGFTSAVLWVLPGNHRARGFYRREGWTETGVTEAGGQGTGFAWTQIMLERSLVRQTSGSV